MKKQYKYFKKKYIKSQVKKKKNWLNKKLPFRRNKT